MELNKFLYILICMLAVVNYGCTKHDVSSGHNSSDVTLANSFNIMSNEALHKKSPYGKDNHPGWISALTIEQYPSEFIGAYERTEYVGVYDVDIVSQIFETVNNTNLEDLLGVPSQDKRFMYMFVTDRMASGFEEKCYPLGSINFPDSISDLSQGYKEVYIEDVPELNAVSRYFFAYDHNLIATSQWIGGLFAEKRGLIRQITRIDLGCKTILWKFIVVDGRIIDKSIILQGFYRDHVPIYHFSTRQIERIPINPE